MQASLKTLDEFIAKSLLFSWIKRSQKKFTNKKLKEKSLLTETKWFLLLSYVNPKKAT